MLIEDENKRIKRMLDDIDTNLEDETIVNVLFYAREIKELLSIYQSAPRTHGLFTPESILSVITFTEDRLDRHKKGDDNIVDI